MPGLDETGRFAFFEREQLFPEDGGKKTGIPRPAPAAGFHDAAIFPRVKNEPHRAAVKKRLVAGEKEIVRRGLARHLNTKAHAFTEALFRGGVFYHPYAGQIRSQGCNIIRGNHKKNSPRKAQGCDKLKGIPRKGFAPERNQQLILFAKTF
jgi:hypothetical protein